MEKNKISNTMKNPNFLKEDIFLDYLIYNNNPLTNEEFIKPKLETFDKYFGEEENSQKLNIPPNRLNSKISFPENYPFNNILSSPEKLKIINGAEDKNILENSNKKTNNNSNSLNIDENNMKKQLFNTIHDQNINFEELKKKKLIMNRESAKKSRLKKKKYVANLEKEFIILKEELIKLKSSQNLNNSDKFINDLYTNKVIENIFKNEKNNTNIDLNLNLNNKEKEIFELKKEEMNITSNNLEKNPDTVKNYANKQKNVLEYLLVKQIDIMTPIKIKNFQNKFLKLETFEIDDNINVIKNKIEKNINTIIELYDIDDNNCRNKINNNNIIINKKNSMSYQLYDFYNNLKAYVDQYYMLFNKIENI